MAFMTTDELLETRDTLETWSQKCLDGLDRMTRAAQAS
jgi:hypothetical protein